MKLALAIPSILFSLVLSACNSNPSQQREQPVARVRRPQTAASSPSAIAGNTPNQQFDYYLLNLSWSPEFCFSHRDAPECAQHLTFTLHGLWPENKDGSFPQNCSNAPGPSDPSQYSDIYPDPGLVEHEWRTHGTCSGLTPDAYFATARTAFRTITLPVALTTITQQTSMPPAQIIGLFTTANPDIPQRSFALSCGNNYLTAVEVCLDKSLHPTVCGQIRSCRANSVRIPPPQ
jgi:ribonuclease T2